MPFESRTSAILAALVLVAAFSLSSRSDAQQAPAQPPEPPSSEDVVFVGAGDIANCELLTGARATAALLDGIEGAVFTLAITRTCEEPIRNSNAATTRLGGATRRARTRHPAITTI